jgi:hypothetical protein
MQHIPGIPRNQMTIPSLEFSISVDNPSRFMDAFVKKLKRKNHLDYTAQKKMTLNPLEIHSNNLSITP